MDWGDTVMRNLPFEGPMSAWPEVEEIPGVRSVLESLQPSFTIALATNAEHSDEAEIRKALDRCDLSRWFDRVFCFRQVGHRKPEPAFYRAILEDLALEGSSVFMVGDSLTGDVRAANAVGISAVWFNPGSEHAHDGPGHRTIHRFEDLPRALRALGAEGPWSRGR